MKTAVQQDLLSISRIGAIQTILQTLTRATGMRTSVVVSLANEKWTVTEAIDGSEMKLKSGDSLDMATTY